MKRFAWCLAVLLTAAGCSPQAGTAQSPAAVAAAADRHPESGLAIIPLTVKSAGATHTFRVENAVSPEERSMGLQFRKALGPFEGMLFSYDHPLANYCFHMRNVPIPLDIVFIGADGRITSIDEREPLSDICRADHTASAVLEIYGGRARELGIAPGDRVEW